MYVYAACARQQQLRASQVKIDMTVKDLQADQKSVGNITGLLKVWQTLLLKMLVIHAETVSYVTLTQKLKVRKTLNLRILHIYRVCYVTQCLIEFSRLVFHLF